MTGTTLQTPAARVDFYILSKAGAAGRLHFACRLTEKAYGLKTGIYAHTSSAAQAEELDRMLWTFRDGSFVPHERIVMNQTQRAPIGIGTPEVYSDEGDLLINLCDVVPTFATNYSRIVEIVPADEPGRKAGRARFRQYRELGLNPTTHNIDKT